MLNPLHIKEKLNVDGNFILGGTINGRDPDADLIHSNSLANPHTVTKSQIGLPNVQDLKVNLTAILAPTPSDDVTSGYSIGSRWFNVTTKKEYVCLDSTEDLAVWFETTGNEDIYTYVNGLDTLIKARVTILEEPVISSISYTTPLIISTATYSSVMSFILSEGKQIITFQSQYSIDPSNITQKAKNDLITLYNQLTSLPVESHISGATTYGATTFTPGYYTYGAALGFNGNTVLDGGGVSDSYFVFNCVGAFTTAAGVTVSLTNGANASNVFYLSNVALTPGANSTIPGTFISKTTTVGLGADCNITGRLLTFAGVITVTTGSIVTITTDPCTIPGVDVGNIKSFAIFSNSGDITTGESSTYIGDIGNNGGTQNGFSSNNVTGNIYPPGTDANSILNFGIFSNGNLIPDSARTMIYSDNNQDIIIISNFTVQETDIIDVKCQIDLGNVTFGNRILTSELVHDTSVLSMLTDANTTTVTGVNTSSTTSTSYVDIPDMTITVTANTKVFVSFIATIDSNAGSDELIRITDGAGSTTYAEFTLVSLEVTLSKLITGLTPGSHTFKIQWKTSGLSVISNIDFGNGRKISVSTLD
jgi:hypothetical protein